MTTIIISLVFLALPLMADPLASVRAFSTARGSLAVDAILGSVELVANYPDPAAPQLLLVEFSGVCNSPDSGQWAEVDGQFTMGGVSHGLSAPCPRPAFTSFYLPVQWGVPFELDFSLEARALYALATGSLDVWAFEAGGPGTVSAYRTQTPEPGTWFAVIGGLLLMAITFRKRQEKS